MWSYTCTHIYDGTWPKCAQGKWGMPCTFSLLGEKGEGVVFSRPLRALRAA